MIYSVDPNQVPIEFSAPVPGVDVRVRPRMKDRDPSSMALEGPDLRPGVWPEGEGPAQQH